jgi:predicted acyltransferase
MTQPKVPTVQGRLLSLDAFRGLTMFLLVAEGARVYAAMINPEFDYPLLKAVAVQFTHHPWNGLRFWDLVQPYFMFIVGVAMPFSFAKRLERGDRYPQLLRHVLYRSAVLFALGVLLHISYSKRLVWELWNVLTQLSFTYLVAFLMMKRSTRTQIAFTFVLLVITELLYRLWFVPGFDQPFVKDHNFGSYVDMLLMGKLNAGGGWVAINCVPTAAHTIWGVLAGQLLRSNREASKKVQILLFYGTIGIIAGYALDPITPIIKRICTSSFVIASGGWCLVTLALFYWIIDVRGYRRWSMFAIIVGTNSIFIYMFSNTIGPEWLNGFIGVFTEGGFWWIGGPEVRFLTALVSLTLHWYLCYWLYQRKIFLKI